MAFGGVDMGKNKAAEALKPITNGRTTGFEVLKIMAIGIRIVTVAVLLIKFDSTIVSSEKAITNT